MDQAELQFIYISKYHHQALMRIVNRCWFYAKVSTVNTAAEEAQFFKALPTRQQANQMFDAVFADFTDDTCLPAQRQAELIACLRNCRRPLITLASTAAFTAEDHDANWLHITLPVTNPEIESDNVRDAITSFWFNLPIIELI